jgi:hypothetical protein
MSFDMRLTSGSVCGRCSWWEGSRQLDGANNLCLENKEGRCGNQRAYGGAYPVLSMYQSCPEFELWNRLR